MRNDIVLTLQAADSNTGDQKKIWLRSVRTLEKELFWQLFVYRMINRWETFAAIGFPSYQHWDRASYMRDLYAYGRNGKRPIFSSAYITCQCSKKQDRVHNFCDMADDMHTKLPGLYKLLRTKPTLQVFCKALTKVFGIAGFTAFQISLDLVYAGLLPDTRDEWADPGPGCRAGLGFIFPEIKSAQYQEGMKLLWSMQGSQLPADFPYHNCPIQHHTNHICLSDIENCLCEFAKYWKLRQGKGRARIIFVPSPPLAH